MAVVAEADQADDAAASAYLEVGDRAVIAAHPQPRLGRQLQRAHHEVADHVRVAAHDVDRVGALRVLGAPEQRAERALWIRAREARASIVSRDGVRIRSYS